MQARRHYSGNHDNELTRRQASTLNEPIIYTPRFFIIDECNRDGRRAHEAFSYLCRRSDSGGGAMPEMQGLLYPDPQVQGQTHIGRILPQLRHRTHQTGV